MNTDSPACPHRPRCPGCPLLELGYRAQLEQKTRALARALALYPVLAGHTLEAPVGAEPVTAFRLRTKLVVEGRALGLFARGTHDVVDIPGCLVQRPRLKQVLAAIRAALPLPGPISSLDLREADDGVLVTAAVPPSLPARERRALAERIAALAPHVASVALSTRESDAPQLLGGALEVLVGPTELRHRPDPDAPWHYAAHGAFVQAHAGQLVRLHGAVEAALTAPERGAASRSLAGLCVLELYGGSGALALRLAAHGARVTLVESFAPAVRLAESAAREQGLELETLAADAGDALARFARENARFAAVIVDPPRRGLAVDVRRLIAALAPESLIYVSCAPETLARDAAPLARLGYALERATPFDMIPQTDAVETLARFVRRQPPALAVLAADETFIAVDKPPHVTVSTPAGAEHGVPLAVLDAAVSGVCLFARTPELARSLESAVRDATAEYILLARGILRAGGTLSLARRPSTARVRYERTRVVAGHSLVSVRAVPSDISTLTRAFAHIGHPVLGDARHGDRRSNAHFSHRYGLDRPFLHRRALELMLPSGRVRLEAPLAPDLAAVLAALESAA